MTELLDLLADLEEYFDGRADAEYFTDSASPVPNEAMRMLVRVKAARSAITEGKQ